MRDGVIILYALLSTSSLLSFSFCHLSTVGLVSPDSAEKLVNINLSVDISMFDKVPIATTYLSQSDDLVTLI